MQIIVDIGNDDFFGGDLTKVGFVSAALEMQLRKVVKNPELVLTAIIEDEGQAAILKFDMTKGLGWGSEVHRIPSYYTFLKKLEDTD